MAVASAQPHKTSELLLLTIPLVEREIKGQSANRNQQNQQKKEILKKDKKARYNIPINIKYTMF